MGNHRHFLETLLKFRRGASGRTNPPFNRLIRVVLPPLASDDGCPLSHHRYACVVQICFPCSSVPCCVQVEPQEIVEGPASRPRETEEELVPAQEEGCRVTRLMSLVAS